MRRLIAMLVLLGERQVTLRRERLLEPSDALRTVLRAKGPRTFTKFPT